MLELILYCLCLPGGSLRHYLSRWPARRSGQPVQQRRAGRRPAAQQP